MKTGQVYSYLRFSDPKQAAGTSIERQLQYAERWAAEHGLPLDESLSLRDEGLSAFHQRHVKQGALGTFLRAVDDGLIPPGSVLVVEGLDRLSRAEPIQAQAQLTQIVNAGITVVTASDGKEYNREKLKAQPMDLVYSLLVMIRAHEESDTKSKRVKAAIRRQCEGWKAGTWRGVIRNGKDPQWLSWNGQTWELVKERAEAVRLAISLFKTGYGHLKIAEKLREAGLQITNLGIHSQQIYRTVRNRALIGEKSLEVDGEEFRLAGYYPPILTDEQFDELQTIMESRIREKGRTSEIPGIITGIGIAQCGYCGGAFVGQNLMGRKRKPNGQPMDGHRRVSCVGRNRADGCPVGGTCSIVPIERALMTYCANQMNLSALLDGGDREQPIRARLAKHRQNAAEIERQLEKITEAVLAAEDNGATPLVFVRKARDLEKALAEAKAGEQTAERELMALASRSSPALADAWAALVNGVEELDYEARLKAKQLVRDTFERIAIYHRGFMPGQGDGKTIDILLVAKGGGTKMLSIDRRTGQWQGEEQAAEDAAPARSS